MNNSPCSCRDTLLGFYPAKLPCDQEEAVANDGACSGLRFSGFACPVQRGLGDDSKGDLSVFTEASPLAGFVPYLLLHGPCSVSRWP